jgi:hypothetical protein
LVFENLRNKVSKTISAQKFCIEALLSKNWLPIYTVVSKKAPTIDLITMQPQYKKYRLRNMTNEEILWSVTNFDYRSEESPPQSEKHIDKNDSFTGMREYFKLYSQLKEEIKKEIVQDIGKSPTKELISEIKDMDELKKVLGTSPEGPAKGDKAETGLLNRLIDRLLPLIAEKLEAPQPPQPQRELTDAEAKMLTERYIQAHGVPTVPKPPQKVKPQEQPKPESNQHD